MILLPLYNAKVAAGFPSPADDYIDKLLSLDEYLIDHPAATYLVWSSGRSLEGIGIYEGDLLIVDRALSPSDGDVVVAAIDGELTCKILDKQRQRLLAANKDYPPIPLKEGQAFELEGVVKNSIRFHRPKAR